MPTKPPMIKTTLRLPEDKHRRFMSALGNSGDKAQRILEAAVDRYLRDKDNKKGA